MEGERGGKEKCDPKRVCLFFLFTYAVCERNMATFVAEFGQ